LFVLFNTTTLAQYTNPVMDAAREAGLIEDIGLSQTVDDVTVTLDWAYADVQRIVLQYTITTTGDVDPQSIVSPFASPQLRDSSGVMFSYASSYPAPGETPNELVVNLEYYTQALVPGDEAGEVIVNNEYFNVDPLPQELDLELRLRLGDYTVPEGMPNAGAEIEPAGPFVFDFTVPLYPAITFEPMETADAAGLSVSLERVTITPANTSVRLCYPLPDRRDWQPEVSLEIGDVQGILTGASLVGAKEDISLDDERWCRDMSFSLFYDQEPTELTVSVDYLTASMVEGPDDWLEIKDALAEQGIKIEVNFTQGEQGGGGVGIEVVSIPDGVDFNEAVNAARESLGDRLGGPWTFTVAIP
jgi:hypothetical protein